MGFGTVCQCNMIWAVMRVGSAQSQRILREAKAEDRFMDWTARRPMKSIVLLTNNIVIASPFAVTTVYNRIRRATETNTSMDFPTQKEITAQEAAADMEDDEDAEVNDGEYEDLDEDQV